MTSFQTGNDVTNDDRESHDLLLITLQLTSGTLEDVGVAHTTGANCDMKSSAINYTLTRQ